MSNDPHDDYMKGIFTVQVIESIYLAHNQIIVLVPPALWDKPNTVGQVITQFIKEQMAKEQTDEK